MRVVCAFVWLFAQGCLADVLADAFYASTPDAGAKLPPDGFIPQGRKLVFMGYFGDPALVLTNGFTVAGPVYGYQMPYLKRYVSNTWLVVAHIGLQLKFSNPKPPLICATSP